MKQLALINPEDVTEEEVKKYTVRKAARAIVLDNDNNIALLYVSKEDYYKLPGGGVEGSEDFRIALQRECLEEIGTEIEIEKEIGSIVEYRKIFSLKQISYCYLVKVKGEKRAPTYTEKELREGFKPVWLPFNKALESLEQDKTALFEASAYIAPRDITLLKAAESSI